MIRKTAFINELILRTLNRHYQTLSRAEQKSTILDDEVGEISNRKTVKDYDKAKLYCNVLHKYLIAKEQITHTENLSPVVTQNPFDHVQKRIKIQDKS